MARGKRIESEKKSGDLSSDCVTSNHQLVGRRMLFALSLYSPPNILLIDFRETAQRGADEVTNLTKAACSESQISLFLSFWFVVLSPDEGGKVEDFNYSENVKKVVEVSEIQHQLVAMRRLHTFGM